MSPPAAFDPAADDAGRRVVRSVCPRDCPDTCGMLTHVEDGRVVKVVGDPAHPITQGFLCGRFQHYEEFIYHRERLLHPLAREHRSEAFRQVSWELALDTIAERFRAIIEQHGPQAILPYSYLSHMGVVSTGFADRLWNKMNTSRVGLEICAMAGAEATLRVFGRIRGTEPEHLDKTRLYLAWGRNPKDTSVHCWRLVKDIHPRIVIDPFRSDTAETADIYLQPRPGTDSMLATGMMRILIEEGHVDHEFIRAHTTGYEALRERVIAISLGEVANVTGVSREQILEATRQYAAHRPALIHIGVGLQRNSNGGEMVSAISMLAALTGQVGIPGGGVLYANYDWHYNDISHSQLRTDAPTMYNMVKLGRVLTSDDEIKALYVYNQNPAATAPNSGLVRAGLMREDLFVAVHDLFMTDTAQRANVVLPAASFAEHTDLHFSYWHDYVQINNQAIAPVGEAKPNSWVFREIARRMGYREPCFEQTDEQVIREALAGTRLDFEELRRGPVLNRDQRRTSFDDGVFPTASGSLELAAPQFTPCHDDGHRYRFITPKSRHLHGSQAYNLPRKRAALKIPWVLIHPDDAAIEGITDGDTVRAFNDRGEVTLTARVSDRVQPGLIVSDMVRWGENANATTPDAEADMAGNATFHSNYVSLQRSAQRIAIHGPAKEMPHP